MKPVFLKQAHEIWDKLAVGEQLKEVTFELEIHKKLLNIFHAGDFYYYIFNLKEVTFEVLSPEAGKILGYDHADLTLEFFLSIIHPEDQPWFLSFENKVAEFFATLTGDQIPNYKVRYDYRVKKKNGEYIRLLQQVITIQFSETGGIFRTLGVHTDISHLKMHGKPVLSFIGLNGEPSFVDVDVETPIVENPKNISVREREILHLLVCGKNTKEIANDLYLSTHTVSTHRKNLIKKTRAKNSADLIVMSIRNGWV